MAQSETALELALSDEEREFLVEFLESTLKGTRIEEHRTRTPRYRNHIERREEIIVGLLGKLGRPQP